MKSVKIFGKSIPLLAIVMVSMLVIGASAYAFVGVASASDTGTLTLYYFTDNKRGVDGGVAVTGIAVYVKTIGGVDVASKGGVSGSVTFALPAGDYKVVSVKGASTRTDGPYTVASDKIADIPCGKLIVNYNTENDGTDTIHGSGTDVTGISVYVKWFENDGDVASAGGVSGSTSFALLAGDYRVDSVKGASTRTDEPYTVASTKIANIPCGKLIVNYNTKNDGTDTIHGSGTDVTGLSVYVKTTAMGDVSSAGGVSGSTNFALLAGDYSIVSVKGASTRTDDGPYTVASDNAFNIPCGKLIVNYNTNNDGTDTSHGTGTDVTGVSVYVKWDANDGDVASAGGVSGSTSFALLAGDYSVVSVKGASSTTNDPYTVSITGDKTADIPCGKLITRYYTNNDGTGDAVTGLSVYVKWFATMGDVSSAGGVSGSTSFALLAGDYNVVSVKGASSRTDGKYTVASDKTVDIPCGKLIVTYYANNNELWGMTGVSVYVKWAAGMGDVSSAGGVSGSTSFALLAGRYKVVSVKGASSRTDGKYTVSIAGDKTADIPVARFRVAVVKSDFTVQTGVSVYVKTKGGGDVTSAGGVNGSVDFSLLQSSGTSGAGTYKFIAVKNSNTAQTEQNANEVPPTGLSGVILIVP